MHTDRCDDEHLQEQGDACREPSWGSVGQLSWGSGCPPRFERWLSVAPHFLKQYASAPGLFQKNKKQIRKPIVGSYVVPDLAERLK